MKKIISFVFACFAFVSGIFAAEDVKKYRLDNNIPVYVKNIPESEVSCVSIVVKGGIRYLNPEQSGLEASLFKMMCRGSKFYSYSDLQNFSYNTLGGLSYSSGRYGSVFSMNCLNEYFEETFSRFTDGFMNPAFGQKEYDLLIEDCNQSIQSTLNNPDSMLFYYAKKMIYAGHPYETESEVTPDSIKNITVQAMKGLHEMILDSRRISIVAGGSFDEEKLVSELNRAFGRIPVCTYALREAAVQPVSVSGKPVVLSNPDAKNAGYVMRVFPAPSVHSSDFAAARLVEDIFSDILYEVVRENYGVCYTPSTFITSSDASIGMEYLYRVSNLKDFKSAVEEAREILKQGKTISGRNEKGEYIFDNLDSRLTGYKNKYVNAKYSSQTTVSGVTGRMCSGLLQFDDIDGSSKITEAVKKVSAEDIERVFNEYWCTPQGQWFAVIAPDEEDIIQF